MIACPNCIANDWYRLYEPKPEHIPLHLFHRHKCLMLHVKLGMVSKQFVNIVYLALKRDLKIFSRLHIYSYLAKFSSFKVNFFLPRTMIVGNDLILNRIQFNTQKKKSQKKIIKKKTNDGQN